MSFKEKSLNKIPATYCFRLIFKWVEGMLILQTKKYEDCLGQEYI